MPVLRLAMPPPAFPRRGGDSILLLFFGFFLSFLVSLANEVCGGGVYESPRVSFTHSPTTRTWVVSRCAHCRDGRGPVMSDRVPTLCAVRHGWGRAYSEQGEWTKEAGRALEYKMCSSDSATSLRSLARPLFGPDDANKKKKKRCRGQNSPIFYIYF